MLWNLSAGWLVLAVASVGILSFILAMALHGIMGEDGFGATGNAVIITAGFFLTLFAANHLGVSMVDLRLAVATGLAGALACLTLLAVAKALMNRLG